VVSLAHSLGWHVTVADGRAHLATEQRFPLATRIAVLPPEDSAAFSALGIQERDAVVLLTHSYEQDRACLQHLLQLPALPRYVGILGPQSRTQHLRNAVSIPSNAPDWARWLHSPVGLDIGSSSPSEIALSIVAEIQAVIMGKQPGGRATELEPHTAAAQP
jgi:xanthine/CO dehydrogenase XdhC/CoxF family maturation factor